MRQQQSHYEELRTAWAARHAEVQKHLWDSHEAALQWAQQSSTRFAAGSLAGLIMLAHPGPAHAQITEPSIPTPVPTIDRTADRTQKLLADLSKSLPDKVQALSYAQNAAVSATLSDYFHMSIAATLQDTQLNRTYGVIGAEQHLMRYPGDSMTTHFATEEERRFTSSGMAPGRGAWGYFSPSRGEMTTQDSLREKYYIAVQTFLAPGWKERTTQMSDFFKFRKMLVVNPENGKAVVAVIGDAGPAEKTGKHLGGSPEVMAHLERQEGRLRGPVLYFFVDDPEDKIPLGPITVQ